MRHAASVLPLAQLLLSAAFMGNVSLAGPPDTLWTRTFGTANSDAAYAVAIAKNSGYLVAGFQNGSAAAKPWFTHTDRDGYPTWQVSLSTGQALDICAAADGGSVVCGWYKRTYPDTSIDAWVSRRDTAGGQVWRRNIPYGDHWWDDRANAVTATHDSGCAVAVATVVTGGHVWLVRFGAAGETLWTRSYAPRWYWSVPYWVGETPDGGFAVIGHSSAGSESDFFLLRTGPAGETLWSRTWGGPVEDRAWAGTATHDHGFALCGYTRSFGAGGDDIWVVRADSAGDTLWSRTYGSTGNEQGFGIGETPDRGFIICASSNAGPWLIRTDSLGDTLWTKTLAGGGTFSSVEPTPEGDIIVAGWKNGDAWLVKLAGISGISEEERRSVIGPYRPTFVRSALRLAGGRPAELINAAGRRTMLLLPGSNDVSRLPPGIYFVQPAFPAGKVVIAH